MKRKIRMGMVGGGRDAFIGAVHRMAAALDGEIELVAGAFSSSPEKSAASGADLFLPASRCYGSYEEMAEKEAGLPEGERIDFVSIVTPNHMHFPVARCFLEKGFHIVSDKPMTYDLAEARTLARLAKESGLVFALTHNYSGYPLVKEARALVASGHLGKILKIVAEYPQGWLLGAPERSDQKQAAWRTDPKRAGASCCVGDIGTHAEHLARYVTGLEIESLCADFTTFVEGRPLEDDANLLIHYRGGARGVLYASQISAGEENGPHLRVHGTQASLEWHQPEPNQLILKYPDQPTRILRPGNAYLGGEASRFTRLPAGHPEAFLEAFANIYREAARAIRDRIEGNANPEPAYDYPGVEDGVLGMAFIEKAVESAKAGASWVDFPTLDELLG